MQAMFQTVAGPDRPARSGLRASGFRQLPFRSLIPFAFGDQPPVGLARVIVCLAGISEIRHCCPWRLLSPALVYRVQAPFRALTRRTHRLAADQGEYWIGM